VVPDFSVPQALPVPAMEFAQARLPAAAVA
jgi:hypothetical protein